MDGGNNSSNNGEHHHNHHHPWKHIEWYMSRLTSAHSNDSTYHMRRMRYAQALASFLKRDSTRNWFATQLSEDARHRLVFHLQVILQTGFAPSLQALTHLDTAIAALSVATTCEGKNNF